MYNDDIHENKKFTIIDIEKLNKACKESCIDRTYTFCGHRLGDTISLIGTFKRISYYKSYINVLLLHLSIQGQPETYIDHMWLDDIGSYYYCNYLFKVNKWDRLQEGSNVLIEGELIWYDDAKNIRKYGIDNARLISVNGYAV